MPLTQTGIHITVAEDEGTHRIGVHIAVHRNRADAELLAGADNAAGNLAAVGNQNLVKGLWRQSKTQRERGRGGGRADEYPCHGGRRGERKVKRDCKQCDSRANFARSADKKKKLTHTYKGEQQEEEDTSIGGMA